MALEVKLDETELRNVEAVVNRRVQEYKDKKEEAIGNTLLILVHMYETYKNIHAYKNRETRKRLEVSQLNVRTWGSILQAFESEPEFFRIRTENPSVLPALKLVYTEIIEYSKQRHSRYISRL